MEAMRILAALKVEPRRTIRVALWSGEEQGRLERALTLYGIFPISPRETSWLIYLNDDPGSGKTLGFYMEGNHAAKANFDSWLEPFKELGARRNIIEAAARTTSH
jgi:hypothetical protein